MTIDDMRALLGLGPEVADAAVVQAYADYLAVNAGDPPSDPPVTLIDLKRQLRIIEDETSDDALLEKLLVAAVDHVEGETGLVLSRREVSETLDRFGSRLRAWPIVSIDAVSFADAGGVDQVLPASSYRASISRRPAHLTTLGWWPATARHSGCVTVTMTAGYPNASAVPGAVIQSIVLLVAEFYENREPCAISAEAQRALNWLLRKHKVKTL